MGMYDTVKVPCPKCGHREDFQSKRGNCNLDTFSLKKAPKSVLVNVNRHSPYTCEKCNTVFAVKDGKSVEVDPFNYVRGIDCPWE